MHKPRCRWYGDVCQCCVYSLFRWTKKRKKHKRLTWPFFIFYSSATLETWHSRLWIRRCQNYEYVPCSVHYLHIVKVYWTLRKAPPPPFPSRHCDKKHVQKQNIFFLNWAMRSSLLRRLNKTSIFHFLWARCFMYHEKWRETTLKV